MFRPSDSREERRISTAGLHVEEGRISGDLAVSRALGDFQFKQCAKVPHSHGFNSHAQICGLTCVRPVVSDASAPAVPNLGQISSLSTYRLYGIAKDWVNGEVI